MTKPWLLPIAVALSLISCKTPVNAPPPASTPGKALSSSGPVNAPTPAPPPPPTTAKTLKIGAENANLLEQIGNYSDLEMLSISCLESLQALPDSIGKLTKLKELRIDNGNGCAMNPILPETIGNLHSLETLVLYGAQDPRDPGPQPAEYHKFPQSMSQLKNLSRVDLGRNGLEEIPPFVKDLPKLRQLGFGWNMNLKEIPTFLSNLRELTTLNLDADGLDDLPDFLNDLPKLTAITLGDNCKITQNKAKKKDLKRRFPRVKFNFNDEYECQS
jgi:Leucine-rich repeat (LRR) protein